MKRPFSSAFVVPGGTLRGSSTSSSSSSSTVRPGRSAKGIIQTDASSSRNDDGSAFCLSAIPPSLLIDALPSLLSASTDVAQLMASPPPLPPPPLLLAAPSQEFEPIVDWAALGTFVTIMFVSLLLVRRTSAVEQAVMERDVALARVRELTAKSLSAGIATTRTPTTTSPDKDNNNNNNNNNNTNDQAPDQASLLQQALNRYEAAVIQEETLRNIVPGVVRIVAPNAGRASEETARQAAKQFLGKEYDIGSDTKEVANPNGQLPAVALVVLAILGISLTALLVFLSLADPMMMASSSDSTMTGF